MPSSEKRQPTAYYSPSLFEVGIGYVLISRFKASGAAEIGVFLVDVHCVGVKNGFFAKCDPGEFESKLDQIVPPQGRIELTAACGRKLVEGAVAYAKQLGIPPHRDYKRACRVFGGIDPGGCDTEFTYGSDGRPLYVQGPNDSDAYVEQVTRALNIRVD